MYRFPHHACQLFAFLLVIPFATTVYAHDPALDMAKAADRLLDTLDEQQRSQITYEMLEEERENWHFLPDKFIKPDGMRYGLALEQMSSEQRTLAYALLSTGMSHKGYLDAMTITSLEKVLYDLEENNPIRNPLLYYITIFGKPGDQSDWGWRFEGHHLSINITIVKGHMVSVTPSFFGTNPAIVKQGSRKGLWTLREEELLARDFVQSLTKEQQEIAIFSDKAPDDIVTGEQRSVDPSSFTPAKGIAGTDLNKEQQALLLQLIKVYAEKFRPQLIHQIHNRTNLFDPKEIYFAWAGGLESGQGHYYRIQTPKFLFEYDNTQNNFNHVHAVWRDFEGDFGVDLLKKHYVEHHAK
jgi:hypothetical protein